MSTIASDMPEDDVVTQDLIDLARRAETEEDFARLVRICLRKGIGHGVGVVLVGLLLAVWVLFRARKARSETQKEFSERREQALNDFLRRRPKMGPYTGGTDGNNRDQGKTSRDPAKSAGDYPSPHQ